MDKDPPMSFAQQLLRRRPSYTPSTANAPPPYSSGVEQEEQEDISPEPTSNNATTMDPRSRSDSAQSLGRAASFGDGRRKLLLVYLHGFMGNETSFQSLPAHVHKIVSARLVSSHTVHTKIYPRYLSRNHISNATKSFSVW